MAAPTLRFVGPVSSTAFSALYACAFNVGDLLLLVIEDANGGTAATPSGWTLLTGTPVGTGTANSATATAIRAYYKFAAASDGTVPVIDIGDHQLGFVMSFAGVNTTTPFDVAAVVNTATASTSVTFPSITTVTNDALVVSFVTNATDTATTQGSSFAHAGLASVTSGGTATTQGNGGGIDYLYGVRTTAGATGTGSCTLATSSVQALLTIALRPAADAGAATAYKIISHAVTGSSETAPTVAKMLPYAVTGSSETAPTVTKMLAYAVVGSAEPFESLSKLLAYAVVDESASAAAVRPQVFVVT